MNEWMNDFTWGHVAWINIWKRTEGFFISQCPLYCSWISYNNMKRLLLAFVVRSLVVLEWQCWWTQKRRCDVCEKWKLPSQLPLVFGEFESDSACVSFLIHIVLPVVPRLNFLLWLNRNACEQLDVNLTGFLVNALGRVSLWNRCRSHHASGPHFGDRSLQCIELGRRGQRRRRAGRSGERTTPSNQHPL